eukprot:202329-Amphidinium_carterae.1
MRAPPLPVALLSVSIARCFCANVTLDIDLSAVLHQHDGTYNMGTHMDVARAVYESIRTNLDDLNAWASAIRLSA